MQPRNSVASTGSSYNRRRAARPASKETPEQFQAVIDVNLNGSYWLAQACLPHMGEGSAVVNVGGVLGQRHAGLPQTAYSSSKAAILALTRDLAGQWTDRKGIRVNALVPGFFASEMTDQYDQAYLAGQVARSDEPARQRRRTCRCARLPARRRSSCT